MAEEILGLFIKDYIYLKLEKKHVTALQDGLASYIKAICYCHFAFLTHIIPILN